MTFDGPLGGASTVLDAASRAIRADENGPRHPNPYILTPLTDGAGFYGRDAALQFVRNTLMSPYQNVIVLFGQRRIGKTSLLHQLMRPEQTPPGFRAVYFDLQGRAEHGLPRVLYGLAREIARSLRIEIPPRDAFAEESYFQYGFLPRVAERLGDERILVLVDEFDVLGGETVSSDSAYNTLFSYLQDLLIDEQKHLTFVFVVGRRIDELPSRIKATFKSAQCKRVWVLDRAAAHALIVEPAAGRLRYEPEAVEALLDLTSGHPYFLQLLCYELFDRAMRAGRTSVDLDDISDDVLEAAMELGMGGLAWFWDEFPPAERFILSSIAHLAAPGQAATLREIGHALHEHGVRLQGMELSTAPMVLAEWGIIESVGRDAFHFRVEFLRRWILRKHSLDEAKRELERVSARAVRDYEIARDLHASGRLDEALERYRSALAANPNHARAQLGLAQSLYERGMFEQAVDAFEKAYRLDPESARDGLAAAHRDLGEVFDSESRPDRARPHFLRVLDIMPEDLSARERIRDSWRATAGAHLAVGRLDQAAEAYREALRYMPGDEAIRQALKELEERHVEEEAVRWKRQQVERAVLESRLLEEIARREGLESRLDQALPTLLSTSALVTLCGMLAAWFVVGTYGIRALPIAIGSVLCIIYAAFALTRHRLKANDAMIRQARRHPARRDAPPGLQGELDAIEPEPVRAGLPVPGHHHRSLEPETEPMSGPESEPGSRSESESETALGPGPDRALRPTGTE